MMKIVKEERPDVIALGYDQETDEAELRKMLKEAGIKCRVVRIKTYLPGRSTSKMIKKIKMK
jgi:FAD synthetase